jgi:hypothetical protein
MIVGASAATVVVATRLQGPGILRFAKALLARTKGCDLVSKTWLSSGPNGPRSGQNRSSLIDRE